MRRLAPLLLTAAALSSSPARAYWCEWAPGESRDFQEDDEVMVFWAKSWSPAQIEDVDDGQFEVSFDGYGSDWDRVVSRDAIRTRVVKLAGPDASNPWQLGASGRFFPKTEVLVLVGGTWCPATVLGVDADDEDVTYEIAWDVTGWKTEVGPDRIRARGPRKEPVAVAPVSAAPTAASASQQPVASFAKGSGTPGLDADPFGVPWRVKGPQCTNETTCAAACERGSIEACAWLVSGDRLSDWLQCAGHGGELECMSLAGSGLRAVSVATPEGGRLVEAVFGLFVERCLAGQADSCRYGAKVYAHVAPRASIEERAKSLLVECAKSPGLCSNVVFEAAGPAALPMCRAGWTGACLRARNDASAAAVLRASCDKGDRVACDGLKADVRESPEKHCAAGLLTACAHAATIPDVAVPALREACGRQELFACDVLRLDRRLRDDVDPLMPFARGILLGCVAGAASACELASDVVSKGVPPDLSPTVGPAVLKACESGLDASCFTAFQLRLPQADLSASMTRACDAGGPLACGMALALATGPAKDEARSRMCSTFAQHPECAKQSLPWAMQSRLLACHRGVVGQCESFSLNSVANASLLFPTTQARDAVTSALRPRIDSLRGRVAHAASPGRAEPGRAPTTGGAGAPASAEPARAVTTSAPADAGWRVGQSVQVEWKGTWYGAEVLARRGAEWRIHYVGWGPEWDEWVPASRIRAAP